MINTITVLYSLANDPLVMCLSHNPNVKLIHVDSLLNFLEPAPWPEVLKATFPSDMLDDFRDRIVVNRVFTLEGTETYERLRNWAVDERWIHIRLADLLGSGRQLTHDMGVRGVSRCLLPLNTQWFRMQQTDSGALVPSFAYGVSYEAPPDLGELTNPIQKSVWSIFDWREEKHMSEAERFRNRFYVEKPVGIPIIVHFYGDCCLCHFPRERAEVDDEAMRRIAATCRRIFASEFGEILLYKEDDEQLRFYSFSPYLLSVAFDEHFDESVGLWSRTVADLEMQAEEVSMDAVHG